MRHRQPGDGKAEAAPSTGFIYEMNEENLGRRRAWWRFANREQSSSRIRLPTRYARSGAITPGPIRHVEVGGSGSEIEYRWRPNASGAGEPELRGWLVRGANVHGRNVVPE